MDNDENKPKKTQKREQLEQAALCSVQQSGLKGLSFRTLAAEVGVKSSSVHYYFPEKADLAFSLIQRYSEGFAVFLKTIDSDSSSSLRQKLDRFIDLFSQTATDDKMCLCGMMAAEVDQLDEKSRELLNRYFVASELWLRELFSTSRHELCSELPPELLAKVLMSGLEGALLLDRAQDSTDRLKAQRALAHSWLL
jgi:TetR/AcrR family transcriptional repressor of nem operon